MKKNQLKNFIVSSADWEIEVDDTSHKSAAISALLLMLARKGKNFMISLNIIVNDKDLQTNEDYSSCSFFHSYEIFNEIGMSDMANEFLKISKHINES
jgi:hypothetical protein